ncbi:LytTR family DNA-binding domain-containing protein [Mucilaginibacter sp. RS28]|uniref:LytTR family DNA-binding domain-containing protein n=1 Tax=Mucilaginibacter straminoryzae TaxID=2932774 RepID=A0A9X1X3B2_9SPHI|nr:LytTR family DNA-binding domain-containing protein [Mucilaginibacter straminoryzae]MCJ8208843.1 LytTR family DNA-binding domain-containing protein [Mucilaginibacter straminoryzae]
MMRCLIVDDEPLARQVLDAYIARTPELMSVGSCSNALQAYEMISRLQPDLVFLDVKMPRLSGLDLWRSLKNPPAVIFTTAYSEYAVDGFELEAVDYLVKPITYERFTKSIHRLFKTHHTETPSEKDYTYFKVSGQLVKVMHNELLYAQSIKDYIQLHTIKGRYLTHMTMKYLSELLPSHRFLRVHRSYLINCSYAERIDRNMVVIKDEQIPVGENYRHMLSKAMDW